MNPPPPHPPEAPSKPLHRAEVNFELKDIPPELFFYVVRDVPSYSKYIPFCSGSPIFNYISKNRFSGELIISFAIFHESFKSDMVCSSNVATRKEGEKLFYKSKADSKNDGVMEFLDSLWTITEDGDGCKVDFEIDFEFRNKYFNYIMHLVKKLVCDRTKNAFIKRANFLKKNLGPIKMKELVEGVRQDFLDEQRQIFRKEQEMMDFEMDMEQKRRDEFPFSAEILGNGYALRFLRGFPKEFSMFSI